MSDCTHHVRSKLRPAEKLIMLTDSDIDRDGNFGCRWLAVTSERVMTFADDGAMDGPETELPLSEVKSVRTTHLVGQVALEAMTDRSKVELIRCSNSLSAWYSKIAKSLTDARKAEALPVFDREGIEVLRCPQCGRLLPEKGSFCPACLNRGEVLGRLWHYIRPHWRTALGIMTLVLAGTAVSLAPPMLLKVLVDGVLAGNGGPQLLFGLVFGLIFLHACQSIIGIFRGRLSAWLGTRIVHELRFDLYRAIEGLSLRRFDQTQTGALLSRLTGDTGMLQWIFTDAGMFIVPTLLQLVGICLILLVWKWWLALLVLIPTPLVIALVGWFHRKLHGLWYRVWQRRSRMTARAQDSISGIRVVKAFSQEPREIDRFQQRSHEFYRAAATAEGTWATGFPIIMFTISIGTYLVWYFGGLSVLSGGLTIGTLMAFINYLGMFYGPLQWLTSFGNHINQAFTAAQRLFEITDADQEVYEAEDAVPLTEPEGAISFNDVHFGYLKDRPVIKGLTLDVKPGEMIGLVGRSGVGKTTMTNLICRFYDVDEGSIAFDGVDLRNCRLRDLRRNIGIVPQESFLFDGTIADNIGYGRPAATREDVIRAAIAANAHGFIMRQPDGYDTRCGERGGRLSGGEKQRIAIARAILHDPKVLILDEATSSVDTQTEALIQEALTALVKGRTTFAIAHRLSTLKNADRLVVIADGKIEEVGTHDELMAKRGTYSKLVEMQSRLSSMKAVDG